MAICTYIKFKCFLSLCEATRGSIGGLHFPLQSQTRLQLQLAPSIEHQVAAMISILVRYNWRQFSVVTSEIAGHDDFVQSVREKVAAMKSAEEFRYANNVPSQLESLAARKVSPLFVSYSREKFALPFRLANRPSRRGN